MSMYIRLRLSKSCEGNLTTAPIVCYRPLESLGLPPPFGPRPVCREGSAKVSRMEITGPGDHSTSELTREVYLHAIPEDQRRAVANVEALLFGPKRTQIASASQASA